VSSRRGMPEEGGFSRMAAALMGTGPSSIRQRTYGQIRAQRQEETNTKTESR